MCGIHAETQAQAIITITIIDTTTLRIVLAWTVQPRRVVVAESALATTLPGAQGGRARHGRQAGFLRPGIRNGIGGIIIVVLFVARLRENGPQVLVRRGQSQPHMFYHHSLQYITSLCIEAPDDTCILFAKAQAIITIENWLFVNSMFFFGNREESL